MTWQQRTKPTLGYKPIMTIDEMLTFAEESEEMLIYLGRPPGTLTDDLREPYRSRARLCYERAMAGDAVRGELWDIAVGKHDADLPMNKAKGSRSGSGGRRQGQCIDCSTDITSPDSRFQSDPRRCKSCRSEKRAGYSRAAREKAGAV